MIRHLLFFLLLISYTSFAQDAKLAKNGLPEGARIISLHMEPGGNHFDTVTQILFRNNFNIGKSDKAAGLIQTGLTKVKGGYIRLYVAIIGDVVDIRGDASFDSVGGHELVNTGPKKGLKQLMFVEMDKIAKSIPHKKIDYLL